MTSDQLSWTVSWAYESVAVVGTSRAASCSRLSQCTRLQCGTSMQADNSIRMGAYSLKFEDGEDVGETYEERARKELRETPESRQEALEKLRDLLRSE